jgi:hypothetical protein
MLSAIPDRPGSPTVGIKTEVIGDTHLLAKSMFGDIQAH